MSTINISQAGPSERSKISSGQYLMAVSGAFPSGETVQLFATIGDAIDVPITDVSFIASGVKAVWLPNCTIYVARGDNQQPLNDDYGIALATLQTTLEDI